MTENTELDTVIIGGGIAGLWLLNRLVNRGYNAVLLERDTLGSPQSIASQGMIHGGIKYALGGALTGESEAIAAMPGHWARCLAGDGDVDLRGCNVLSEDFYLWSTRSLTSRVSSFFASKLLRGRVDTVSRSQRPAVFDHPDFKGSLYRLADLVLDAPSLLSTLATPVMERIARIDWGQARFIRSERRIEALEISLDGNPVTLPARHFVLTAGAGNEALLQSLDLSKPAMQRRPLQQVLVKHDYPQPLYAHCMGSNPSPRLTVSSHRCSDGRYCWYLGGDLATEGVGLDSGALIDKARAELDTLFPWIDFGRTEWATLPVDRAEPRQPQLVKPDQAYADWAEGCENLLVGWPTKLTLAPDMAARAESCLHARGASPSRQAAPAALAQLPKPEVATPFWETLF